ncbi:MAG TPA: phytoene/squalene synthase family protein, partial [Caulobacter sp.]|nr:phytoene/squalene synthase family protein [Caulobacter sp.]
MTDLAAASRETIQKGSQSFAAAAALFDPQTRADAEMLYAWCRHCDDVIDGQMLGHEREMLAPDEVQRRLEDLYARTRSALAGEPTDDPAFAAFREVARRRAIPERYAIELIDGFAMDVAGRRYATIEDTLDYCWHVAGVVGAMMAIVMGVRPDDLATLRRAQDLGLAFQLTNIARDIVEDAQNDRFYLPADWLAAAGVPETAL